MIIGCPNMLYAVESSAQPSKSFVNKYFFILNKAFHRFHRSERNSKIKMDVKFPPAFFKIV